MKRTVAVGRGRADDACLQMPSIIEAALSRPVGRRRWMRRVLDSQSASETQRFDEE
jgi:hypothetical protein